MAKKPALRGAELLRATINQITQHPETYDPEQFHSEDGTQHDFFGWAQILAGKAPAGLTWEEYVDGEYSLADDDGAEALGLTPAEMLWLGDRSRTIPELYSYAKQRFDGPAPSTNNLRLPVL